MKERARERERELASDKCTHSKTFLIKASVKCPKCKCKCKASESERDGEGLTEMYLKAEVCVTARYFHTESQQSQQRAKENI